MSDTLQERVKAKMARNADMKTQSEAMGAIYEALLTLPDTENMRRVLIATAILLDVNLEPRP